MAIKNWAVLPFEAGHHIYIQNKACERGIPAVFPMVEGYNERHKIKVRQPALGNIIFVPAQEDDIDELMTNCRFFEKPWRNIGGDLQIISNAELQAFMVRLDRRDKKAKKEPKSFNLSDLAGKDAFTLWQRLYGLVAAIKRFGNDLR